MKTARVPYDLIVRIVAKSFAGFNVDVGYDTDFPHGSIPLTVDRLTAASIGFNIVPVGEGGESTLLEIETSATQVTMDWKSTRTSLVFKFQRLLPSRLLPYRNLRRGGL